MPTKVSLETVRDILDTSRFAPSGGNTQPWHVYVVAGESKRCLEEAVLGAEEMDTPEYGLCGRWITAHKYYIIFTLLFPAFDGVFFKADRKVCLATAHMSDTSG